MGNVVELRPADGPKFSDGEYPHGTSKVWGIVILARSSVSHFWTMWPDRGDRLGYHVSACGQRAPLKVPRNGQNILFGPGNIPKCKRCMDALRRRGSLTGK